MKTCAYCPTIASIIHDEELLCERHYDALYFSELKVKQLKEVPKPAKQI